MKNLIRTVSVEVNGKKVNIRFFSDPEIIKVVNNCTENGAILCKNYCKLFGVCEKLKDPYHLSDNNHNFVDFCNSAGIGLDSRDFDAKNRLTLKELGDKINDNPELYEELLNSGKESFSLAEIILEFEGSYTYTIPCYEDIEPILEDLKIKKK